LPLDDAEIAVLKDGGDAAAYPAVMPPAMARALLVPLLLSISSPGLGPHCLLCPAATLSPGSDRSHAWLQYFLF
jgi:hypothetical protein